MTQIFGNLLEKREGFFIEELGARLTEIVLAEAARAVRFGFFTGGAEFF